MQQFFRLRRRWWWWWWWWIWEPPLPVALSYTYKQQRTHTHVGKTGSRAQKNCFYQENMVLQQQQAVCWCPGVPPFENQCLPSWTRYSGLTYMSKGWSSWCFESEAANHKLFFKKWLNTMVPDHTWIQKLHFRACWEAHLALLAHNLGLKFRLEKIAWYFFWIAVSQIFL